MSDPTALFPGVPSAMAHALWSEYQEQLLAYRASDWEKVGLKSGKICEIMYCVCVGLVTGTFPATASKPPNFPAACIALEQHGSAKRSHRIQIPRLLIAIYELRNNRAIGHVSGEIEPNVIDAELFLRSTKWVLAELIRSLATATTAASANEAIESVNATEHHSVFRHEDLRSVLAAGLTAKERVLVLLADSNAPVATRDLREWAEYKNSTDFKRYVLKPLHKAKLVIFDEKKEMVHPTQAGREAAKRAISAKGR